LSDPSHDEPAVDLSAENRALRAQVSELQQQLDWLKRQLFGRKSEKRLIVDNPQQGQLLSGDVKMPAIPELEETVSYKRRKKQRQDTVTDTGLRFDDSVPVKTIEIEAPELKAEPDRYEVIDYKDTYRLAQRPGSYEILRYRRPVLKELESAAILSPPAPANVLEKSLADVSFLAGMLVDKFCYHLPFYRQHERLAQSGVQLARGTLTNLSQRAIELLRPIYEAQRGHVLQS